MDNKVGLAPDAATTAKLLDKLRNVVATFRTYGITLSKDERRVLLHARIGAEPHIARIRDVAVKHGLSIPDVPLQGMMNDLELFTLLRPFQDAFAAALALVDDTAAQAESEAWEAFLAYYGVLAGMAPHHPTVAVDMAPIIDFMATGPRQPSAPAEPPPAPAPSAPANEPPKAKKARRAAGRTAMSNRVGDQLPDDATRAQLAADLEEVVATWTPYGVMLSVAQRRRLHHARLGCEPHIARIRDIAQKHGIAIDGIPLQGMLDDFSLYTTLRSFQDELRAGAQLLDDTAGTAESEAWEAFLAYYGSLSGMAKHMAVVAVDLAPIVEFMSHGPRKAPPPKG